MTPNTVVLEDVVALCPPKSSGCHIYSCTVCGAVYCPFRPEHPFEEAWRHHKVTGEPLPTWMKTRRSEK